MTRATDQKHLRFVRELSCIICGDNTSTEAAHVRYSEPRADKNITGMGIKPADRFVVPLCGKHHREQHQNGERLWWAEKGIDAVFVALALYSVTGDNEAGNRICAAWRT